MTPTCDNGCTRAGWVEYFASCRDTELHVSVPPDTDLDDTVRAFCHDGQEMITINGWMADWEQI